MLSTSTEFLPKVKPRYIRFAHHVWTPGQLAVLNPHHVHSCKDIPAKTSPLPSIARTTRPKPFEPLSIKQGSHIYVNQGCVIYTVKPLLRRTLALTISPLVRYGFQSQLKSHTTPDIHNIVQRLLNIALLVYYHILFYLHNASKAPYLNRTTKCSTQLGSPPETKTNAQATY